jgi:hypothetical protein
MQAITIFLFTVNLSRFCTILSINLREIENHLLIQSKSKIEKKDPVNKEIKRHRIFWARGKQLF